MPRPKSDPLLSALIAKLPASGEDWPVDRQLAWLNMFATAMGVVYGGDAAARLGAKPAPVVVTTAPPKPRHNPAAGHPFIIDKNGFVKRAEGGKRVLPDEVDGTIFDTRGIDSDLRTIIWKDNSRGLNGRDLTIVS